MPLMAHEDAAASAPSPSRRHHGKRLRRWLHGKENSHENNSSTASECSSASQQQNINRASNNNNNSGGSSFSSTNVEECEDDDGVVLDSPTIMYSLSDTEVIVGSSISPSGRSRRMGIQRRRSTNSVDSTHSSEKSIYSTKRKGVKYSRDGAVVCCRFCDILRARDEEFLYEDELITVFRPLAPVVESHILVVPRCHIRNVNMLTKDHLMLLQRMKEVAALVLQQMPPSTSVNHSNNCVSSSIQEPTSPSQLQQEVDYKFAFHTPPFNSIDHVHMHAFRRNEGSFGCFGAIKYRTETWWCRSFEQIISRLAISSGKRQRRHHHHKHQQNNSNSTETSEEAASSSF